MEWRKKEIDPERIRAFSKRYDIDLLSASILIRRGISKDEDLCFFFETDYWYLHNSFLLDGMKAAVERIRQAEEEKEKVLIFGDRDVDGVTSTVLIYDYCRRQGLDVSWAVPTGEGPYGITKGHIETFAEEGGTLIILVDCGISLFEEVRLAKEKGISTIILDHHQPRAGELPAAEAVVDPKREHSSYPFSGLAGCGVVLKTIWALGFSQTPFYDRTLCFMHVKETEEGPILEVVKHHDGIERERISQPLRDISPDALRSTLSEEVIILYRATKETKALEDIFGPGVIIDAWDLAKESDRLFPSTASLPLKTLLAKSRLRRYLRDAREVDILVALFKILLMKIYETAFLPFTEGLDLAALGTIGDLVPLANENRILVRKGIHLVERTKRKGLRDLLLKLDMLGMSLTTSQLGWRVVPVLNAAGRMGKAHLTVELLTTEDPTRRRELIEKILLLNKERQKIGKKVWREDYRRVEASLEELEHKAIFLEVEDLPRGVTGVIAAQMSETFSIPAVVLSVQGAQIAGSIRCGENYRTGELLDRCASFFESYGGHACAAGFRLKQGQREAFRERAKGILKKIVPVRKEPPFLTIDAELPKSHLVPECWEVVKRYEPYGRDFLPFLFMTKSLRIEKAKLMGRKEEHLKLVFDSERFKWPSVFWKGTEHYGREFTEGDYVDVVYQIGRNRYQAKESLQLVVRDIRKGER